MSDFDAYRDDMERISRLSDQEIDRLLAGKAPAGDADLEELAAFVQDMETLFKESPTEETAGRHLAAVAEAAQVLPAPADRERSGHARFRSRSTPMRAKLVVASAGLLLVMAFGGAAYAGALPGSVQGTVADLAGSVGVTLPDEDADDVDENEFDDGDVSNVDEGDKEDFDDGPGAVDDSPADEVDDDDQGGGDDDQKGDVDDDDQGEDDQGDDAQGDDDDQGEQEDADEGDRDDEDKADRGDREDGDQGDEDDGDEGSSEDGDEDEGGDE